jgi:hypothetical protein
LLEFVELYRVELGDLLREPTAEELAYRHVSRDRRYS